MARAPAIRELAFRPAQNAKAALGFEVFKLSQLYARFDRELFDHAPEAPLRMDFHVIYVGLRGRGDIIVDFASAPLGAGWLTVVSRGRVHQYTARSRQADAWMLLCSPEFLATGVQEVPALLSSRAAPSFELDAVARTELITLCEVLAAEYQRPLDALQRPLIGSLLRTILLRAERSARGSTETAPADLVRFFAALEREVLTTRSVAHFARATRVSPRRLGDLLARHVGRTAKQVIDERVILEAKRLLAHSELSIKELAAATGFSEPTNFVKFFKLHANETPLAFRARFHHRSAGPDLGPEPRRR